MREDLARLETEKQNKGTINIDTYSTEEVLRTINDEDKTVAYKIAEQMPSITKLTDAYIDTIKKGHRVFYIGCGTSGRLGFIDAAELVPTYAIPDDLIVPIMAGGLPAMRRAKEYAEDDADQGIKDMLAAGFVPGDMLIGIAASGRTPYVKKALMYAKENGCPTGSISCCSNAEISDVVDFPVEVVTGQEVVLGSTRMKAGTATKLVLNMISTAVFIRLGHVYKNYLIQGKETTEKCHYRIVRLLSGETGISEEICEKVLTECDLQPKPAMCMLKTGKSKEECLKLLDKFDGHLRNALKSLGID